MKPIIHRQFSKVFFISLAIVIALVSNSCGANIHSEKPTSTPQETVGPTSVPDTNHGVIYGVVRGTPYRGMPRIIYATPDKSIPTPYDNQLDEHIGPLLPNITIQIREYYGKDQRAGVVIAETTTNQEGFYEFRLPTGTYFLTINGANVKYVLTTTGYGGQNFLTEDKVNDFEIIEMVPNATVEQNLVVPQSWPQ